MTPSDPAVTTPATLTISIVTYRPDHDMLNATIDSLAQALAHAVDRGLLAWPDCRLFVIDNGGTERDRITLPVRLQLEWIVASENRGFGAGHNLCLQGTGDYHLILNPDVLLENTAIAASLTYLACNPDCGLVTPDARWPDGQRQFLCKRHPALLDLLLRGFAPAAVRARFARRLDHYEMRDRVNGRDIVSNPPLVSGCFMFFRGATLRAVQGFDDSFFLYFEDFDLSVRTGRIAGIAHVPEVRIIHFGGHAARKGWRHVRLFAASALRFYRKHGWKWA